MNATQSRCESNFDRSVDSLVTLPDGRRMTYDAIIRDAQRRRSQAVSEAIRALFDFNNSTPGTASAMLHRQRFPWRRQA